MHPKLRRGPEPERTTFHRLGAASSPNRPRYSSLLIMTSTCTRHPRSPTKSAAPWSASFELGLARKYETIEFPGHVLRRLVTEPFVKEFLRFQHLHGLHTNRDAPFGQVSHQPPEDVTLGLAIKQVAIKLLNHTFRRAAVPT